MKKFVLIAATIRAATSNRLLFKPKGSVILDGM
jgi:hypothetical protein